MEVRVIGNDADGEHKSDQATDEGDGDGHHGRFPGAGENLLSIVLFESAELVFEGGRGGFAGVDEIEEWA